MSALPRDHAPLEDRGARSPAAFFPTAAEFRAWLEAHHASALVLNVGFFKVDSGRPSITWREAVGEALCFGWIDGVRRRIDDARYEIRFSPRKPASTWSAVNVARVGELEDLGLMRAAGRRAFARRAKERTAVYAHEQATAAALSAPFQAQLESNADAWEFFKRQPPWYRRVAAHRVMEAKLGPTRERRLAKLIESSAAGRRL